MASAHHHVQFLLNFEMDRRAMNQFPTQVDDSRFAGENLNGSFDKAAEEPTELTLTPLTPLSRYKLACFDEPLMERWRECLYHGCKRRRRCMAVPRGTFKKFGRPMCFVAEGR